MDYSKDNIDLKTKLDSISEWIKANQSAIQEAGSGLEFIYTAHTPKGAVLNDICYCNKKDYAKILMRMFLNARVMYGWEEMPMDACIDEFCGMLKDFNHAGLLKEFMTEEDFKGTDDSNKVK